MSTIALEVRSLLSSFPHRENNLTGLGTRGKRKRGNLLLIIPWPSFTITSGSTEPTEKSPNLSLGPWVFHGNHSPLLPSIPAIHRPMLHVDHLSRPSWLVKDVPCCAKLLQSCLTLCDPMDCSQPDSSVHGILQARILEFAAMPSSRGSFQPRDWTCVSYTSCISRQVLYH